MKRITPLLIPLLLLAASPPRIADVDRNEFANPSGETYWAVVHSVGAGFEDSITSIRYLPDGDRILAGSDSGELSLIEINTGRILWKKRPFPNSNNPVFVEDVDPTGRIFLTRTGIGAREDHTSLNVHSTKGGSIVREIEEDSHFYQPGVDIDHRSPGPEEIGEREQMGLGESWRMKPLRAEFTANGSRILATFANLMSGPDLYDRSFKLYDAAAFKKIWEWQVVADRENFDDNQPAGFQIGLPAPALAASADGKTFYYGTAHARIHILNEQTIRQGASAERIEDKEAGPLFGNPTAEGMTDMGMGINDLALSDDGGLLFASAGEGGTTRIIVYSTRDRKEVFRTSIFDSSTIRLSPGGRLLAVGHGLGGGSRLHLFDLQTGALLYMGPKYGTFLTGAFAFNPRFREIAVPGGDRIHFIKERRVAKIAVGTSWTKTNLFLKNGVSLQVLGSGGIAISTGNVPESERWSYDETDEIFFGDADGNRDLAGDRSSEGEVYLKAEDAGSWTLYGGLSAEEARSVKSLRAGPMWGE